VAVLTYSAMRQQEGTIQLFAVAYSQMDILVQQIACSCIAEGVNEARDNRMRHVELIEQRLTSHQTHYRS